MCAFTDPFRPGAHLLCPGVALGVGKYEEDELEDDTDDEAKLQPVSVGDQLPSITLKNEKGEDVDIAKLADNQGVVIFLVPKADTRKFIANVWWLTVHQPY